MRRDLLVLSGLWPLPSSLCSDSRGSRRGIPSTWWKHVAACQFVEHGHAFVSAAWLLPWSQPTRGLLSRGSKRPEEMREGQPGFPEEQRPREFGKVQREPETTKKDIPPEPASSAGMPDDLPQRRATGRPTAPPAVVANARRASEVESLPCAVRRSSRRDICNLCFPKSSMEWTPRTWAKRPGANASTHASTVAVPWTRRQSGH